MENMLHFLPIVFFFNISWIWRSKRLIMITSRLQMSWENSSIHFSLNQCRQGEESRKLDEKVHTLLQSKTFMFFTKNSVYFWTTDIYWSFQYTSIVFAQRQGFQVKLFLMSILSLNYLLFGWFQVFHISRFNCRMSLIVKRTCTLNHFGDECLLCKVPTDRGFCDSYGRPSCYPGERKLNICS